MSRRRAASAALPALQEERAHLGNHGEGPGKLGGVSEKKLVRGNPGSSAGFAGASFRTARLGRRGPSPAPSCGSHYVLGGGFGRGAKPPSEFPRGTPG